MLVCRCPAAAALNACSTERSRSFVATRDGNASDTMPAAALGASRARLVRQNCFRSFVLAAFCFRRWMVLAYFALTVVGRAVFPARRLARRSCNPHQHTNNFSRCGLAVFTAPSAVVAPVSPRFMSADLRLTGRAGKNSKTIFARQEWLPPWSRRSGRSLSAF